MSQTPSNDDLKRQIVAALEGNVNLKGNADTLVTIGTSEPPLTENFTFFHKEKSSQAVAPLDYVGSLEVAALISRFKIVQDANAKTKQHIVELMELMAEIANGFVQSSSALQERSSKRLHWLFYGCIAVLCLGWFLLFPSGHVLVNQVAGFFLSDLLINHFPQS